MSPSFERQRRAEKVCFKNLSASFWSHLHTWVLPEKLAKKEGNAPQVFLTPALCTNGKVP